MAIIRKANRKDRAAVVDLWTRLADYHAALDPVFRPAPEAPRVFAKFLRRCMKSKNALVLLAEERGVPVGMCMALIDNNPPIFEATRFGRLSDLFVDADYRRRGIGTELLQAVRKWLAENGVTVCRASAAEQNPALENFWLRSGFDRCIAIVESRFGENSGQHGGPR